MTDHATIKPGRTLSDEVLDNAERRLRGQPPDLRPCPRCEANLLAWGRKTVDGERCGSCGYNVERYDLKEQQRRLYAMLDSGYARMVRELAGWSLSEVAAHHEVTTATVHRWEVGMRRPQQREHIRGHLGLLYQFIDQFKKAEDYE